VIEREVSRRQFSTGLVAASFSAMPFLKNGTCAASGQDPTVGRNLIFDDEFEKFDLDIWHAGPKATTAPSGFYGRSAFARISGEMGFNPYRIVHDALASGGFALEISAKYIGARMNIPNYYGNDLAEFQWVSGNIQTASIDGSVYKGWRRGYFEARMRFPAHPLTCPAFWLLNRDSILNPKKSVEVDIVEHKGWEHKLYGTYLHEWGQPDEHHEGIGVPTPLDLTQDYYRYGMLVEDTQCIAFFERKPVRNPKTGLPAVWRLGRAAEMEKQGDIFWPLLTLSLRTDVPFPNPLRDEFKSAAMRVDYFRVYA
jgi:beta-glucanase (GH16 family)